MKNKLISLFLIFSLLLSGCASRTAPSAAAADAFTFVDDLDRTVTVSNPQRVACLLGSFAQVWQLAGGQVIATADDAWEDFGLELPADAVNLGGTKHLSLELLLSAQPDFIIASTNTKYFFIISSSSFLNEIVFHIYSILFSRRKRLQSVTV